MSDYEGRTVCGWCGVVITPATKPDLPDSHGICDPCGDALETPIVAFDWDHPAISISHGPRRVSDLSVPWFVRPSMDTDLYGAFLLVCSLVAALFIGIIWGAA